MVSPVDDVEKCGSEGEKVDLVPHGPTLFPAPILEEDEDKELLPQEVRDNFDQIRSLVPQECGNRKKKKSAAKNSPLGRRCHTPCPSIQLKRRKVHQIAASTVMLIDDEVSRWMRGIAELEQLLAQTNSEGDAGEISDGNVNDGPDVKLSESISCPCFNQENAENTRQERRLSFDDKHENDDDDKIDEEKKEAQS